MLFKHIDDHEKDRLLNLAAALRQKADAIETFANGGKIEHWNDVTKKWHGDEDPSLDNPYTIYLRPKVSD